MRLPLIIHDKRIHYNTESRTSCTGKHHIHPRTELDGAALYVAERLRVTS